MPFIFIAASTGFGKTQFAFALKEPILYIPCIEKSSLDTQHVYSYFLPLSEAIFKAVDLDLKALKAETLDDVSMNSLPSASSFTKGLISSLIQFMAGKEWIGPLDPYDIEELRFEAVAEIGKGTHQPILILDEFYDETPRGKLKLAYLRNILRQCKFKVIVMGTHCSAVNLFSAATRNSSRETKLNVWCFLWHRLPKRSPDLGKAISSSSTRLSTVASGLDDTLGVLLKLISTERPLVQKIYLAFLEETLSSSLTGYTPVSFFSKFITYLYDQISTKKPSICLDNGGVRVAFAFSVDCMKEPSHLGYLNSHFAIIGCHSFLKAESDMYLPIFVTGRKLYLDAQSSLRLKNLCGARFRPFEEETCLRIALMGWKNKNWDLLPYDCFGDLYVEDCDKSNPALDHRDVAIRDGALMESLTRLCILQATHSEGFDGANLLHFCTRFYHNYFSVRISKCTSNLAPCSSIYAKVPFFGPIGGEWHPDMAAWAKRHDVPLGAVIAPPDKFMTDMLSFPADNSPDLFEVFSF